MVGAYSHLNIHKKKFKKIKTYRKYIQFEILKNHNFFNTKDINVKFGTNTLLNRKENKLINIHEKKN